MMGQLAKYDMGESLLPIAKPMEKVVDEVVRSPHRVHPNQHVRECYLT
jgi:hypothetical protein